MVGLFYAKEDLNNSQSYAYGADYTPYLSLILTAGAGLTPNAGRLGCLTNPAGFSATCFGAGIPAPAGPVFTAQKAVQDHYDQSDETIAFFTNNTVKLTDALELTVGLRYTKDDKKLTSRYDNLGANGQACGGALGNQGNANPALRTPGSLLVPICLPWANPLFDGLTTNQNRSENEWSGTAKLAYRWSPALMTYVSYARGYKIGRAHV